MLCEEDERSGGDDAIVPSVCPVGPVPWKTSTDITIDAIARLQSCERLEQTSNAAISPLLLSINSGRRHHRPCGGLDIRGIGVSRSHNRSLMKSCDMQRFCREDRS
jgi:hypothetical protein